MEAVVLTPLLTQIIVVLVAINAVPVKNAVTHYVLIQALILIIVVCVGKYVMAIILPVVIQHVLLI